MARKQILLHVIVLLLVSAVVFGFSAGTRDFWGRHGEVRRAEVSREMVASGNWLVPHLNGEPFVTKPPLYYWSAAWMFRLRGSVDELGARIPSLISATLGVLVTYCWAGIVFSPRIGLSSGLILATSFLYGGMARTAGVDMMLTLFTTAALGCLSVAMHRRNKRGAGVTARHHELLLYGLATIWIALGTMTKNPIGFVVPLLAFGVFVVISRDVKVLLDSKPWWMLLIFLLVILPWFFMVFQRVPNFLEILNQETLGRYTNPEGTPHHEPFYYYLPALGAFAPWVLFLPGVVLSFLTKKAHQISRSSLFVLTAFITTFVLFSSVGSKREYYLLPLYPFLAILVACYWDEYLSMKKTTTQRWTWKSADIPIVLFAGILCLAGLGLPFAARVYLPQYTLRGLMFGLVFLICGIALYRMFVRGAVARTFGVFTFATILIYVFALTTIVPEVDRYRSRKEFFHDVAAIVGTHAVIDYNYEGYAPQFYMQRTIPVMRTAAELESLFQQPFPSFVLMTDGHYRKLQRDFPELAAKFQIELDRSWISAINPKRQKRLVLLKTHAL